VSVVQQTVEAVSQAQRTAARDLTDVSSYGPAGVADEERAP